MVSYKHGLRAHYDVSFLHAWTNDFADDVMSPDFSSNSWSTYGRYIRVARLVLKKMAVIILLQELIMKGAGTKNVGGTNEDNETIFSSNDIDV